MERDIILQEYNFSNKITAVLITVCVLLSLFVPFSEVKSAEWYDSGWIYLDNPIFHADDQLRYDCGTYFDHPFVILWAEQDLDAWLNLNVSAGNYKIDMRIGYGHRTGTPPQTNETMRVYSGTNFSNIIPPTVYSDKADIPDMGDNIIDSYSGVGCLDVWQAIKTYSNVTGRTLKFPETGDLAIKATGDSLLLHAVRIYGYKEESGTPFLVIQKSVDKTSANPGDEIVYTLNYQNTGNGTANNVVVKDPFNNLNQNYLTFVSSTPSPSSGIDTWNIGVLNAGQSGQITIRAKISNSMPIGSTEIKNRFNIDSNETNLQYSNYVSTIVNVSVPNPTCSISASPSTILNGQSSTLSWTSQNATSCTASNAWSGAKSLSGNQSVSPSSTSTYALTCTGSGGTANCSTAVSVIATNPSLTITKSVDKTSANPGDEIVYTLNYQNTGNGTAANVVIIDPFNNLNQNYLTFIGSTPSPTSGNDTWNIGTLAAGQSGQITIRAKISNNLPNGYTQIQNRATIDSNETSLQYSNYASTWVYKEPSVIPNLSISKLGRNITTGTSWAEITNALSSQKIAFSIMVTATGGNTNINNVFVNDLLPHQLTYIFGSTKVDGNSVSDGIAVGGINIGNFSPGQSKTITFEANVTGENFFPFGQTTLTNIGGVWASGISRTDTAQVIVTREQAPNNPYLNITKSVDKTSANPGDEIVYTLNYQNTGDGTANNIIIHDPFNNLNQNYLTFVSSTPSPTSGNDTWNIGALAAGQSGQITIRAKISNNLPNGYTQIQNRASIDSNETSLQYSNYASTWVYKGSESISLNIDKLVRNISDGTSFRSSIDADPKDEVEFSLEIRNTSNNIARNVRAWDNLPSRLEYISGSTLVDGSYRGDGIIGSGINIGDISANSSKLVKFKARVEDYSYYGTAVLTNYGYTAADNYQTISDTATIRIEYRDYRSPGLNIDKLVRNITRGYGYWTTSVYAQPNDEIEFLIKINSIGNQTAENVKVKDSLPSKLIYVSGSTTVDGSYGSDSIVSSNGINIGDLSVGNYREVKFKVRVASADNFGPGTTALTNYGYTWANEVSQISDTAQVLVQKEETSQPIYSISISKLGRNISRGESVWLDSVLASPSQEIEFSIQVTNIGNSNLTNVKVWDNLPVNISIISNSTTIDGVSWGGNVIGAGLNLGTLTQGQTKTIKFRAKIAIEDNFGVGSTTLINTAYTVADNVSQISDQGSVIVVKPGEVRGAELVPTGANTIGLGFLAVISAFIALFVYCRTREEKLLEILNSDKTNKIVKAFIRFYFRVKFFVTITKLRFKQIYW